MEVNCMSIEKKITMEMLIFTSVSIQKTLCYCTYTLVPVLCVSLGTATVEATGRVLTKVLTLALTALIHIYTSHREYPCQTMCFI